MEENMYKQISQRIKDIRLELGLSQSQFGEKLFVSQDTVSLWELGKSLPSTEYVIRLATEFELSADYILCLEN